MSFLPSCRDYKCINVIKPVRYQPIFEIFRTDTESKLNEELNPTVSTSFKWCHTDWCYDKCDVMTHISVLFLCVCVCVCVCFFFPYKIDSHDSGADADIWNGNVNHDTTTADPINSHDAKKKKKKKKKKNCGDTL